MKESIKSMAILGSKAGKKSGCRFCLARDSSVPVVGERIRVLSDFMAGRTGTVVPPSPDFPMRPETIIVQMDDESPEYQTMVNTELDLIEILPGIPVPEWEPPLPLRDLEELDQKVVRFCEESIWKPRKEPNWLFFYEIIRYVWQARLPIELDEIWGILKAHGVPENRRKKLVDLFHHGREVLVYTKGRKPIRNKRL